MCARQRVHSAVQRWSRSRKRPRPEAHTWRQAAHKWQLHTRTSELSTSLLLPRRSSPASGSCVEPGSRLVLLRPRLLPQPGGFEGFVLRPKDPHALVVDSRPADLASVATVERLPVAPDAHGSPEDALPTIQ